MLPVVTSYSTVCSLSLHGLSVGSQQAGSHETKRTETLCEDVGLDITMKGRFTKWFKRGRKNTFDSPVVILASPNEVARGLQSLSNHVVDQSDFRACQICEICVGDRIFDMKMELTGAHTRYPSP